MDNFCHLIPIGITNRIKAMMPPNASNADDCIAWKQANDRVFTLASAYSAVKKYEAHPHKKLFLAIWQWNGPERIRGFLWKLGHDAILSNETRFRRGDVLG